MAQGKKDCLDLGVRLNFLCGFLIIIHDSLPYGCKLTLCSVLQQVINFDREVESGPIKNHLLFGDDPVNDLNSDFWSQDKIQEFCNDIFGK